MTPSENETTIRQFLVPELNFNANDYSEMIDWQKCLLTESPITVEISDETLEKMILKREVPELNKFPCHTQAVERYVKTVAEASAAVRGVESRDGYGHSGKTCFPQKNAFIQQ